MWLLACAIAMFAMAGRTGASEQNVSPQGTSKKDDARLPAGVKLYWGEEPTESLSVQRGRICLNGIWEFVPMLDRAETEPPSGKAYIHVLHFLRNPE